MTRCFRVAQFSLSADTDHPAICQHACELPQTTATVDPLDRFLAILKTLRSLWWVPAVVIPVLWFIDWRESLVKRGWALHAACIADQQKSFMDLRPDVDRFFDSYNSRDLPLDRAEVVWRATIEACSTREAFERWRMQSESWDVYSEDEYLDRSLTTTADVGGRFSGRFKGEWIRGDWDTKSAMSAC